MSSTREENRNTPRSKDTFRRVLFVSDEPSAYWQLGLAFASEGDEWTSVSCAKEALEAVDAAHFDAVLIDVESRDPFGRMDLVQRLGRLVPRPRILLLTDNADNEKNEAYIRKLSLEAMLKPRSIAGIRRLMRKVHRASK